MQTCTVVVRVGDGRQVRRAALAGGHPVHSPRGGGPPALTATVSVHHAFGRELATRDANQKPSPAVLRATEPTLLARPGTACPTLVAGVGSPAVSPLLCTQNSSSAFGAFLDPVADKLMVATVMILLCTQPLPLGLLAGNTWLMPVVTCGACMAARLSRRPIRTTLQAPAWPCQRRFVPCGS